VFQNELYDLAKQYGFLVVKYYDCPSFYSSWSISFSKNCKEYEIVYDGRDGWMQFSESSADVDFKEIDLTETRGMGHIEVIEKCRKWLSGV
jgi:hypothetical protein